MSAPTELEAAGRPEPTRSQFQLQLEDTLASTRRLWVRGRLLGPVEPPKRASEDRRWWARWRDRPEASLFPPTLQLEMRLSGHLLKAEVPVLPDGRFEALFTADLPLARRGWRVARHRATWGDFSAEACGVVLAPPPEALGAVVAVLPLEYTLQADGAQRFAASELASRLTRLLRTAAHGPSGFHPIYYLACVPPGEELRPAEWALAATALGWPAGHFLLVPPDREGAGAALLTSMDRIRWLSAGSLEVVVLNLEPTVAEALTAQMGPAEDRALVHWLVNPEDDPWKVIDRPGTSRSVLTAHRPRATRASLLPRHPVVFCHGMLAFSTLRMQLPENLNSFSPLREFLRERGFRVLFPQVAATSGVAERAAQLREQILRWTDEPVNLIAHSMGGLDARHMITHLGMADHVRTLTTISTPHRGTYLADWFLANFHQRVPLLLALQAFGVNVDGFRDCCLAACQEFSARTPDCPQVRYFSYGGDVRHVRVSPVLRRAWTLLRPIEGRNDGMVSLASARWGEYLGTIHADHFAQTPDAVFLHPGEDFDSLGFYSRLVEDLARRGF